MRSNPPSGLLTALACLMFTSVTLGAKPTRSISRDSTRRLVAPASSRGLSRERATHRLAGTGPDAQRVEGRGTRLNGRAQASAGARRVAGVAPGGRRDSRVAIPAGSPRAQSEAAYAVADAATVNRVHAWEQAQRNAAAHAAIAAADRKPAVPWPAAGALAIPEQDEADDNAAAAGDREGYLPWGRNAEDEGSTAVVLPSPLVASLYDERGRLTMPPPLFGSHEILLHQNQMADRDGLGRVRDDADLLDLRRAGRLVELPENEAVRIDERLPANRRYSRPWTAEFLSALARDYYASFHSALLVDSAVRTVAVQRRLLRTNGNAAPISGDTASPHLTGEAIDIAKGGLSLVQIAWMRTYLQPLMALGQIDVEEEFQQACFHISVYRGYLAGRAAVVAGQTTPEAAIP
jgi:hypothetical protein